MKEKKENRIRPQIREKRKAREQRVNKTEQRRTKRRGGKIKIIPNSTAHKNFNLQKKKESKKPLKNQSKTTQKYSKNTQKIRLLHEKPLINSPTDILI